MEQIAIALAVVSLGIVFMNHYVPRSAGRLLLQVFDYPDPLYEDSVVTSANSTRLNVSHSSNDALKEDKLL